MGFQAADKWLIQVVGNDTKLHVGSWNILHEA